MSAGPYNPAEDASEGSPLDGTDAALEAQEWAAGLDVWAQVERAYIDYLGGDNWLANAQLWSLREAIRAELREELGGAS